MPIVLVSLKTHKTKPHQSHHVISLRTLLAEQHPNSSSRALWSCSILLFSYSHHTAVILNFSLLHKHILSFRDSRPILICLECFCILVNAHLTLEMLLKRHLLCEDFAKSLQSKSNPRWY